MGKYDASLSIKVSFSPPIVPLSFSKREIKILRTYAAPGLELHL